MTNQRWTKYTQSTHGTTTGEREEEKGGVDMDVNVQVNDSTLVRQPHAHLTGLSCLLMVAKLIG